MAAYAIAYGFRLYSGMNIDDNEEDFTWIGENCYMTNSEYEILEEILEKEF